MYCRWKLGLPNEGPEKKMVPLPRIGTIEFVPGQVCEVGGLVYDLVKGMHQLEWLDEKNEDVKAYLESKNPVGDAEPVADIPPQPEKKFKIRKEE